MALPRQRAWLDVLGEWSSLGGPMLHAEGGVKLTPRMDVIGSGSWSPNETRATAGLKVTW